MNDVINVTDKNTSRVSFGIKDHRFKHLYCNEFMAELLNLDSPKSIYQKTDDFLFDEAYANRYQHGDLQILNGKKYENKIELFPTDSGIKKIITTKHPLLSSTESTVGIIYSFTVINNVNTLHMGAGGSYIIHIPKINMDLKFTRKEMLVLKQLSYGITNSMIAERLFISKRTVEKYIENIKQKLQCKKRAYIIQTLYELNIICDFAQIWQDMSIY